MGSLMQSFGNILPSIFHSMSMSFSNSILFFVFLSVNTVRHAKAFRSFSASFSLVLYKIDLLSPLALLFIVHSSLSRSSTRMQTRFLPAPIPPQVDANQRLQELTRYME